MDAGAGGGFHTHFRFRFIVTPRKFRSSAFDMASDALDSGYNSSKYKSLQSIIMFSSHTLILFHSDRTILNSNNNIFALS